MHAVRMFADTTLQVRVDADDLRVLCRDRQDLGRTTTDDDRWVRFLHRLRVAVEIVDRVVVTLEAEGSVRPETLHDGERLIETRDPDARLVEREAALLVVDRHPPGTHTELEPTTGQQVDRRCSVAHNN